MRLVRNILAPAGTVLGALVVIAGYISTGRDILSWGLPVWFWQTLGAAIFFASVIAILIRHQKAIDKLTPQAGANEEQDDKAKSALRVAETAKTDSLTDRLGITWLDNVVFDHWNDPTKYIHPRLIKVFQSSPTEIGLVTEWFNCSIFELRCESVNGEVRMAELTSDFESLGHQITLVGDVSISKLGFASTTYHLQVVDTRLLAAFRDAIGTHRTLRWSLNLSVKMSTVGYSRPVTVQQAPHDPIFLMPTASR